MALVLLILLGLIGPGIALKALTPHRFSLVSYLLGQSLFLSVFLYPGLNSQWVFPMLLSVTCLAVVISWLGRPLVIRLFSYWNHLPEVKHNPWLHISMASSESGILLSAPMAVLATVFVAAKFHSGLLALLPDFVDVLLYQQVSYVQLLLLCALSGCVGMLILLTYRIVNLSAGVNESPADYEYPW